VSLFDQVQEVRENIQNALHASSRKSRVTLVAATKTQDIKLVKECIENGIVNIGENRVQEAYNKLSELQTSTSQCVKRMIGHLQSNKINKALTVFDTIDSIDTLSLAKKISAKVEKKDQNIQTLLEINTSREQNKFGFLPEDNEGMLESIALTNINVQGLMTLGPNTNNETEIERSFSCLRKTKEKLNKQLPKEQQLTELSMGMSGDYEIAIRQGSTMVRLGSALFGSRS
tara:strand:+ start:264 stop:953 length:690 start_codon:yes stop_codon:yes gene_type:complete